VTTRESRLERNQDLFRGANERLEGAVGERVLDEQVIPFLCECPDEMCMDTVAITLSAYEAVRSKPNHFIIVSGHPTSPGERVVTERDGYLIVEKSGDK
jgi:hypothetical protein